MLCESKHKKIAITIFAEWMKLSWRREKNGTAPQKCYGEMLQTHSPYDLLQGSHSQDSYCGGRGQNSLHEATPEQGGFSMVYTQEVS